MAERNSLRPWSWPQPRITTSSPTQRHGKHRRRTPEKIPLTIPEIRRLVAATQRNHPPGHAARWLHWRRRHQARSRWFHKRARLNREYALVARDQGSLRSVRDFARKEWPPSGAVRLT